MELEGVLQNCDLLYCSTLAQQSITDLCFRIIMAVGELLMELALLFSVLSERVIKGKNRDFSSSGSPPRQEANGHDHV